MPARPQAAATITTRFSSADVNGAPVGPHYSRATPWQHTDSRVQSQKTVPVPPLARHVPSSPLISLSLSFLLRKMGT